MGSDSHGVEILRIQILKGTYHLTQNQIPGGLENLVESDLAGSDN
jgi:hypothetical protein